jgi:transposase-like protein
MMDELKRNQALGQRCRCRVVPYLNNNVEQDHRAIGRRINASLGFRSFAAAAGIATVVILPRKVPRLIILD